MPSESAAVLVPCVQTLSDSKRTSVMLRLCTAPIKQDVRPLGHDPVVWQRTRHPAIAELVPAACRGYGHVQCQAICPFVRRHHHEEVNMLQYPLHGTSHTRSSTCSATAAEQAHERCVVALTDVAIVVADRIQVIHWGGVLHKCTAFHIRRCWLSVSSCGGQRACPKGFKGDAAEGRRRRWIANLLGLNTRTNRQKTSWHTA